jgi:hypothetical protein
MTYVYYIRLFTSWPYSSLALGDGDFENGVVLRVDVDEAGSITQDICRPLFRWDTCGQISFLFLQYRLTGPCHARSHWAPRGIIAETILLFRLDGKERLKISRGLLKFIGFIRQRILHVVRALQMARSIAWHFAPLRLDVKRGSMISYGYLARDHEPGVSGSLFIRNWLVLKVSIISSAGGYM